jgi:hypothetical protein
VATHNRLFFKSGGAVDFMPVVTVFGKYVGEPEQLFSSSASAEARED